MPFLRIMKTGLTKMSMYNPTGSGNVHVDKSISGRKKVAAKKLPPALAKKAAAKKVDPAKKAAAKKAADKKPY